MSTGKLCLVVSQEPYPAFDSVSSIIKEIIGHSNIVEVRIREYTQVSPIFLKIPSYILQELVVSLKLISMINKEKVRVVFMFQRYYPLTFIICRILNLKLLLFTGGSNFIWSYMESESAIDRVLSFINLPMQRICHELASVIITLSQKMVESLGLMHYQDKTLFALPRLDQQFFKKFRTMKKYENRENVVGFIGPLIKRKGILELIESIPLVVKEINNCKFVIIGNGPLLKTIQDNVQKLKLDKWVSTLGYVDYDSLEQYYNEMRLLVIPSYTEGIPSVLFEAMACGTPILATPVGGIPDIVTDLKTALLLDSNKPSFIAHKIIEILSNESLLKKVSENALRLISENLYEKNLSTWRKILKAIGYQ